MGGLLQDFRLAVRTLKATPVVTTVAVLSLALGIGATSAIFALVDGLVLRPLPVAAPDRLVTLSTTTAVDRGGRWGWSFPVWDEIRRRPDMFDGSFAWGYDRFNVAARGETVFVDGLWVSASSLATLGVRPILGRAFDPMDDVRGGGPDGAVAVISHRFWRRYFNSGPDAIGRTLILDTVPVTVVGVLPERFLGPEVGRTFDVALPLGAGPLFRGRDGRFDRRSDPWLSIMARLRPGDTRDAAMAALRSVQTEIWTATVPASARPEYRDQYFAQAFALEAAANGESNLRRQYGRPLTTILAVVALLLLIACANIANVMLARGAARAHELSLRLALGASRWHLVRQQLAESVLVAAAGLALGLAAAAWSSRALERQISTRLQTVSIDLSLDARVVLFTVAVGVVTTLIFGIAPAVRAARVAPIDALKAYGRNATDVRSGLASGLVVVQVAVSLMLVVAAGLFGRTFASLSTRSIGFDRDRVLLATLDARRAVPPEQRIATYARIQSALRTIPDADDAAISLITPVGGQGLSPHIDVPGGVAVPGNVFGINGVTNVISPGWFRTYGVPMIAGRDFSERDVAGAAPVAIVNQTLARAFLPNANPLGRTITLTTPGRAVSMAIVGVAADSVYMSMREVVPATVYTPLTQFYLSPGALTPVTAAIRSKGGAPDRLTRSVAAAVARVNPDLLVTLTSLSEQIDGSLRQERLVATVSGFFGVLALIIAALGLYGVTSYAVTRRRTEIGVRMALGARTRSIVRLVLGRVAALIAIGIVVGAAFSLWAARFVAPLLFGLEPTDPWTFVSGAAVMSSVGAFAGWLPAWRASRIDPATVVRDV